MGDIRRELLINNASTTLNGAITSGATSITVTDGSVFFSDCDFRIMIESEILKVTQVATNTLTVERGVEGTSAAAHADASTVTAIVTAQSLINYWDQINDFKPSVMHPAKILDASGNVMDSTDFTWLAQGTSTAVDEANGNITLTVPGNSAAQQWRGLEIDPGSTPWTIEAFIQLHPGYLSGTLGTVWGLFMRESSSGRIMSLHNKQFSSGGCSDYTSPTVFSATNKLFSNGYDRAWFKLEDDGTDITFSIGVDGEDYFQVFSEARGTFFTTGPDRVGFGFNAFDADNATVSLSLISWIQS